MLNIARAAATVVAVRVEQTVPANDAAEVPAPIAVREIRAPRESSGPRQQRAKRQMGPLSQPRLRAHDMLPAPCRQEAMVSAADELGAVLESHAEGGLDHLPGRQDLSSNVAPVRPFQSRSVDLVTRPKVGESPRPAIPCENSRLTRDAVRTRMHASPIRIDTPPEAEVRAVVRREDVLR